MPRAPLRDNAADFYGATHAYLTGTANTTAAAVVAAAGAGRRIRVKAFRFVYACNDNTPADITLNHVWLADGATAILAVTSIPGKDVTFLHTTQGDTGFVTLPGAGRAGTANTALNIDFTATDADVGYQLDVFYDVIDANGEVL